jgi:hypothetical protein
MYELESALEFGFIVNSTYALGAVAAGVPLSFLQPASPSAHNEMSRNLIIEPP